MIVQIYDYGAKFCISLTSVVSKLFQDQICYLILKIFFVISNMFIIYLVIKKILSFDKGIILCECYEVSQTVRILVIFIFFHFYILIFWNTLKEFAQTLSTAKFQVKYVSIFVRKKN